MKVLLNLVDITDIGRHNNYVGRLIIQPLTGADRQFMTGVFPQVQ